MSTITWQESPVYRVAENSPICLAAQKHFAKAWLWMIPVMAVLIAVYLATMDHYRFTPEFLQFDFINDMDPDTVKRWNFMALMAFATLPLVCVQVTFIGRAWVKEQVFKALEKVRKDVSQMSYEKFYSADVPELQGHCFWKIQQMGLEAARLDNLAEAAQAALQNNFSLLVGLSLISKERRGQVIGLNPSNM